MVAATCLVWSMTSPLSVVRDKLIMRLLFSRFLESTTTLTTVPTHNTRDEGDVV